MNLSQKINHIHNINNINKMNSIKQVDNIQSENCKITSEDKSIETTPFTNNFTPLENSINLTRENHKANENANKNRNQITVVDVDEYDSANDTNKNNQSDQQLISKTEDAKLQQINKDLTNHISDQEKAVENIKLKDRVKILEELAEK